MKKNTRLKKAIIDLGLTQREFSKESGINEWYLSTFINGRYAPRPDQKATIVGTLNKLVAPWKAFSEQEIFPEGSV